MKRLLTLMYHRVSCGDQVDPRWVQHLETLVSSEKYNFVVPGDDLLNQKLNLCLTFDDATADFYFYVFPLIKKLKIKVVLAVPAGLIAESSLLSPSERMKLENMYLSDALCTWPELQEMVNSGWVKMASHGFSHQSFRDPKFNFDLEAVGSKQLLESKLGVGVNTFVFPFGQDTSEAYLKLLQHYELAMRVGHAVNLGWMGQDKKHYRINADPYWMQGVLPKISFKFYWKRFLGYLKSIKY